jgi:hypothetical protein
MNSRDRLGTSLLANAVRFGFVEAAKMLLEMSAGSSLSQISILHFLAMCNEYYRNFLFGTHDSVMAGRGLYTTWWARPKPCLRQEQINLCTVNGCTENREQGSGTSAFPPYFLPSFPLHSMHSEVLLFQSSFHRLPLHLLTTHLSSFTKE